jgi:hypothetical protein
MTFGRRECRLAIRLAAPSAAPPTSAPIAPLTIVPRLGPLDSETAGVAAARPALVADRRAVLEAPVAPRSALVDLVGLGLAPPALLALGFALVPLFADALARDAFAPRGFDAALVPVLRVARPLLAGAALRLLDWVPAERVVADLPLAVVALLLVVLPFAERLLAREVVLLDVFLRGLLVVAKAFRLQRGVTDGLPLSL